MTLGTVLQQGPRTGVFLMGEVPLFYVCLTQCGGGRQDGGAARE